MTSCGIFIVNLEQIWLIFLGFLVLNLNMYLFAGLFSEM